MYPVITYIRQKLIVGVLAADKAISLLTGKQLPKSVLITSANVTKLNSSVKILEETEGAVTIAKLKPYGSIKISQRKNYMKSIEYVSSQINKTTFVWINATNICFELSGLLAPDSQLNSYHQFRLRQQDNQSKFA